VERDEAKAIHADAKNWPLSIELFQCLVDQRLWISRVYLSIRNANGKSIFEDSLDGPTLIGWRVWGDNTRAF
jgi:hypothetical protein